MEMLLTNKNEEFIKSYSHTKFEKIISTMIKIKAILQKNNTDKDIIKELDWVVENIINKTLFDIDFSTNKDDLILNLQQKNYELQEYFRLIELYTTNDRPSKNLRSKNTELSYSLKRERRCKVNTANQNCTQLGQKIQIKGIHDVNEINELSMLPLIDLKVKKNNLENGTNDQDDLNRFILVGPKVKSSKSTKENTVEADNIEETKMKEIIPITNTSNSLKQYHKEVIYNTIDFDIFSFCSEVGRENVAPLIYKRTIEPLKLHIDPTTLSNFINEIILGYNQNNPYHNEIHAADVCQTLYSWLNQPIQSEESEKNERLFNISNFEFSSLDIFSIYTAAIIHDFKHTGFNNSYYINTNNELAILYNDKSVLENMHIAQTFKVILKPENNILAKFSLSEYKDVRKRLIEAVLATDMSYHNKIVSGLKQKMDNMDVNDGKNVGKLVNLGGNKESVSNDQQELINFFLHSADISHNTKEWKISEVWSKNVYDEFFNQGDYELEHGLTISNFCDRRTTVIPKDQVGFINFIITPNFDLLLRIFPNLKKLKENIENNKTIWKSKF